MAIQHFRQFFGAKHSIPPQLNGRPCVLTLDKKLGAAAKAGGIVLVEF